MSSESKFGEPWKAVDSGYLNDLVIVDKDNKFILGHSSDEGFLPADDPRWNRIVACVNFCRLLSTENIERCVLEKDGLNEATDSCLFPRK